MINGHELTKRVNIYKLASNLGYIYCHCQQSAVNDLTKLASTDPIFHNLSICGRQSCIQVLSQKNLIINLINYIKNMII